MLDRSHQREFIDRARVNIKSDVFLVWCWASCSEASQGVSVLLPHGWDMSHFLSRHRDRKWLISWRARTEQQVPGRGPSSQFQPPSQSQHLPSTVSQLTLGWRSIDQSNDHLHVASPPPAAERPGQMFPFGRS